jgi:hypothetical protein
MDDFKFLKTIINIIAYEYIIYIMVDTIAKCDFFSHRLIVLLACERPLQSLYIFNESILNRRRSEANARRFVTSKKYMCMCVVCVVF